MACLGFEDGGDVDLEGGVEKGLVSLLAWW